jgi:hypothetical protein
LRRNARASRRGGRLQNPEVETAKDAKIAKGFWVSRLAAEVAASCEVRSSERT